MKVIITEEQFKKLKDIGERSRSFAFTRKKRLFSKPELHSNPLRYKKRDRDWKPLDEGIIDGVRDLLKLRKDGTTLRVSQNFWDWIKWQEGDVRKKGQPILKTYKDKIGKLTIGYGHTGRYAKLGKNIDLNTANKILYEDAKVAADCVRRMLSEWKSKGYKGYKLFQHEFDALVSIAFHAGCNGFRSAPFLQNLKRADYRRASDNIIKFKSVVAPNRRKAEQEMFKNKKYVKF